MGEGKKTERPFCVRANVSVIVDQIGHLGSTKGVEVVLCPESIVSTITATLHAPTDIVK